MDLSRKSFCHRDHRENEFFSRVSVDSVAKQRVIYARGLMKRFVLLLCAISLLISCAPQTQSSTPTALASTASEAQKTLINFFDLLNAKKYAEADLLYGGDYEQLQIFNADADPSDHAALWAWSCENSGLQCLKVRAAVLKLQQGNTQLFQVEFSNTDGSLFVLGPCCGADETEMPPVSQFDYHLARTSDGTFRVMDLPPYTP